MYKTKFTLVKFSFPVFLQPTVGTVGSTKKGTVRIKLTHFYNFSIVGNLLTRDGLELTYISFQNEKNNQISKICQR
jgi:hypothetical protein